jgi:hypothetical protein
MHIFFHRNGGCTDEDMVRAIDEGGQVFYIIPDFLKVRSTSDSLKGFGGGAIQRYSQLIQAGGYDSAASIGVQQCSIGVRVYIDVSFSEVLYHFKYIPAQKCLSLAAQADMTKIGKQGVNNSFEVLKSQLSRAGTRLHIMAHPAIEITPVGGLDLDKGGNRGHMGRKREKLKSLSRKIETPS